MFYLAVFFISTSYCEENIEQVQNNSNALPNRPTIEKKEMYNLSDLRPVDRENIEKDTLEVEGLSNKQKKYIIAPAFLGFCVITLFVVMNTENHDLQKRMRRANQAVNRLHQQLSTPNSDRI